MRLYNKKIGYKIIDIIYEREPNGIGRNQLVKVSGYAKDTIDEWLNRLRDFGITKQTRKYPRHLTYESIQKYENNSLFIPDDARKKILQITKNRLSEREKRSIILILSLMAFGVYKPRKYNKAKGGLIEIRNPFNPEEYFMYGGKTIPFVAINDVVGRIPIKSPDSISKTAYLPTKKINYGNNELFGYLNLTEEETQQIFAKLLNHNPPIIKTSKMRYKNENQASYMIADDLLKEFVTNCILTFNLYVEERLLYSYIYDLFEDLKKDFISSDLQKKDVLRRDLEKDYALYGDFEKEEKSDILAKEEQLKEYKKNMKRWFGNKRKTKGIFAMIGFRKQELKEMKKNGRSNQASELTKHFKKIINERDQNVKNRQLFDDKFENVHVKYKALLDKYGVIVNIFLDILFPQFLTEIWKSKI